MTIEANLQTANSTSACAGAIAPSTRKGQVVWSLVLLVAVSVSILLFRNRGMQAPVWTVPYLSGAANYTVKDGWRVQKASLLEFKRLDGSARWRYRAPQVGEAELMPYNYLSVGFVHVVRVARALMPWLGDLQAVAVLQCLIHLVACWAILMMLPGNLTRGLFVAAYAANPLVIYFVTFPFYYFWQSVVPLAIVYSLLRQWRLPLWQAIPLVLMACASVWIRPSTLFVAAGFAAYLAWRKRWAGGVVLLLIFAAGVSSIFKQRTGSPTHTMFAGLGAYGQPEGLYLSDESVTKFYERQTGEKPEFSDHTGFGGNWYEPGFRARYNSVVREGVRDFARRHPWIMARNAGANTLQGFSIGYLTQVPDTARYVVAFTGFVFFLLLARSQLWTILVANALALGSFTLYYPPVPAYMFGSYVLLAVGAILIISQWADRLMGAHRHPPAQPAQPEPTLSS